MTSTGAGASRVYTSYTVGSRIYDYDVTYLGVSPYVHGEISPGERLRVHAGLRYDNLRYRFDNDFTGAVAAGGNFYGQASDTTVRYEHLSPKLGATWALTPDSHLFASYNHAFRAPSESQLFRPTRAASAPIAQANAQAALGLDPVKAEQAEIGLRGKLGTLTYNVSLYQLAKHDDILSYRDTATNITQAVNAGETRHRGLEAGLGIPLGSQFRLDLSASYARHTYEKWVIPGSADFSGNEMEAAPRVIANTRLSWQPAPENRVQLEWLRLGSYWMDQANTTKYGGYNLYNLRVNWRLAKNVDLFGSIRNLSDRRYADSASISSNTPVFSPGLPRTAYLGLEAKW